MEDTEKENGIIANISKHIELITKIVIGATASCYAIGILIVNLYFGKYSFYSLSLFRLSYAIAGFWSLATLAFFYISSYVFVKESMIFLKSQKKIIGKVVALFVALIVVSVFLSIGYFMTNILGISLNQWWFLFPLVGSLGIFIMSENVRKLFTMVSEKKADSDITLNILFGVFLLIAFLVGFSRNLYETIPANLGGGHPQPIKIIVQNEIGIQLQESGIPFQFTIKDSSKIHQSLTMASDTLSLILSTDQELVFFSKKYPSKSFVINRDRIMIIEFFKGP